MKPGITLTKKDTVVAIISIAFLLMNLAAVQQRGSEQAKNIICKANLKIIGQAQFLYLDDNNDHFPPAWRSLVKTDYPPNVPDSDYDRFERWHDERFPPDGPLFSPYIENQKAVLCPTFVSIAKQFGNEHKDVLPIPIVPQYTYSMNGLLGSKQGYPGWNASSSYGGGAITRHEVTRDPSEVFLFSEEDMLERTDYSYGLNDNALCGFGLDWFGTFHNTNIDNMNSGTVNAVFVDGHVQEVISALKTDYSDNAEMEFGRFEKYCWPHQDKEPIF